MTKLKGLAGAALGLCAALALAGCTTRTASLENLPAASDNAYVLGAGDQVHIYVYGLEPFTATSNFTVSDDGSLSLPLLDKVPAGGKTFAQLEDSIRRILLERQILTSPMVNVQPAQLRPFYILGEVNKPGEYAFRPGMSVLSAVSMAGGFTLRANEKEVAITRTIDARRVVGRAGANDLVRPGDQIQVYERWF